MHDERHEEAAHVTEELVAIRSDVVEDSDLLHAQVDDVVRRHGAVLEEQLEQLVDVTQYPACARTVAGALRQPAVSGGEDESHDVDALLVRQVGVGTAPTQQPEAVPERRPAQLDVERVEAGEKVCGPRHRRGTVGRWTVHVDAIASQQVLEHSVDLWQHAVEVADPHTVGASVDDVGEHQV